MRTKIVAAIGTRPDILKMMPVVDALQDLEVDVEVWWSGQGKDMFPVEHQYLVTESEKIDWGKGLIHGISQTMVSFSHFLSKQDNVDAILVHGDDATAYATGIAGYLAAIRVGHVEAGLRTYQREPYPEEAFRRMIGAVATWHFAPDLQAAYNLCSELGAPGCANKEAHKLFDGMPDIGLNAYLDSGSKVFIVGNTINDTLPKKPFKVLATLHRRENWGKRIVDALKVLNEVYWDQPTNSFSLYTIRHPNWKSWSKPEDNEYLEPQTLFYYDPMSHDDLIKKIQEVDLVVTDSGGLQEEAAFLGTPCICVRTTTERTALVENGAVELVHPDRPEELREALDRHLNRRYAYGKGDTSVKIAEILMGELE